MKKAATPAVDVVQEDARQIAPDLLSFTSRIVKAYVARNALSAGELPAIIGSVHASLLELGQAAAIDHPALRPTQNPAVPISKSVTPKFIVCLEDGKRLRTMKRYLRTRFDLTPDRYRARWNLPHDYPMVAPDYAAKRSALAKKSGLGRKPGKRKKAALPFSRSSLRPG